MKNIILLLAFGWFILAQSHIFAQSVYAPLNRDYEHLIERYEIKYGKFADAIHSHIKPYTRKSIMQLVDSVQVTNNFLSEKEKFNLTYLTNDNWEWADSSQ
ncbi:MAG: hypothetical protein H7Y04_00480, partial [Verrucomicrobia bacterium]|nr:hypothetical protein [Cytophagales bacterium]